MGRSRKPLWASCLPWVRIPPSPPFVTIQTFENGRLAFSTAGAGYSGKSAGTNYGIRGPRDFPNEHHGRNVPGKQETLEAMESLRKNALIAPCGMNCGICAARLREKNPCPGCRGADLNKPVTRVRCKIKTCQVMQEGKADFCFECRDFPCANLKHLDQRYRTKYKMSMVENLEYIRKFGINKFFQNEEIRWACAECGGTICVHTGICSNCGRKRTQKIRPGEQS